MTFSFFPKFPNIYQKSQQKKPTKFVISNGQLIDLNSRFEIQTSHCGCYIATKLKHSLKCDNNSA